MEEHNGFLNLNEFCRYPFTFLNCVTSDSCRGAAEKKERCKLYSLKNSSLFLVSVFLILACNLVSGESWDGVPVSRADYRVLRTIKDELIDFRGALRSWNDSGYGVCSGGWAGIKCEKGQVIAIQLPWKGLGGQISEKIGLLRSLRRISLHDNVLGGSIPVSLGLLPNLRGVYLFNNQLSGSIPPSLVQSSSIQNLDLSQNQLNGTIPVVSNSSRIYRFNLSYNAISGSIPASLTHLSSLTFLSLEHNNLSGPIPNTWGSGLDQSYQLESLTLDHNFLSGNIPASLSKLGSLEEINLGYNQLTGIIPYELGSLSMLQVLDLSNNAINGSFPDTIPNLHSLVSLNLQNNHLFNQIPENVDRLKNLSVLNLNDNRFNGDIPATIGNLSSLTQLDFSRNNFSGEIPDSLANLKNLSSFDVSYNQLSGSVPSALSKKFNSTSFVGNLQLCGYSVSTPCPSVSPSSPPPPQVLPSPYQGNSKHGHRKLRTKDIILIAAGVLLLVLIIICCFLLCCLIRKKMRTKSKSRKTSISMPAPAMTPEVESGETGGKLVHFSGPFVFTADDLLCATAEIMGKSTYGTSYKATLEDGNQVAVKRLREKVTKPQKEFETEVADLGKIRHPNILALRAYYLGPKGEKLLVFDYMSHGSLASFLHARGPETVINWPTRMKIIMGITKGLCFLHNEENIVHGNLTSNNVLLDEQNNPTIADVALSRLMTSAANTNVMATAGTLGYRAPELSKLKNANEKTDVYSLGVIMLELLTGKSPSEATDGNDLPQWVASIVKEEWTNEVFDLELMGDASNVGDELLNTLKLALHCVDPGPAERPEAHEVMEKLEEIKPELAQSAEVVKEVPAKSE